MSAIRASHVLAADRTTITKRLAVAREKIIDIAGDTDRAQAILEAALGPIAAPRIRQFLARRDVA